MPTIPNIAVSTLASQLRRHGRLTEENVERLVDQAMQDGQLTGLERNVLRGLLNEEEDLFDGPRARTRLRGFLGTNQPAVRQLALAQQRNDGVIDAGEARRLERKARTSPDGIQSLVGVLAGSALTAQARSILMRAVLAESTSPNRNEGTRNCRRLTIKSSAGDV